jgi:hypothetical protein
VEAAVATLQELLADGDPADAALQSHGEAVLTALRVAYRSNPAAFSKETIEALRELSELLRQADPDPDGSTLAEPHEQRTPLPPASRPGGGVTEAPELQGPKRGPNITPLQDGASPLADGPKPIDGREPPKRLSQKESAKKMRQEAYLRAKEYRKTDPRQIAMKEKLKQQRRDAYQKAKERGKALRAERKKAADEHASLVREAKQQDVLAKLVPASTLKPVTRRAL